MSWIDSLKHCKNSDETGDINLAILNLARAQQVKIEQIIPQERHIKWDKQKNQILGID